MPVLRIIVDEYVVPILTVCGLAVKKSNSQLQMELQRPLSFKTSLDSTVA